MCTNSANRQWVERGLHAVFSKCLLVGVALPRESVESDVSYNLSGLGKSLASPSFRKILSF